MKIDRDLRGQAGMERDRHERREERMKRETGGGGKQARVVRGSGVARDVLLEPYCPKAGIKADQREHLLSAREWGNSGGGAGVEEKKGFVLWWWSTGNCWKSGVGFSGDGGGGHVGREWFVDKKNRRNVYYFVVMEWWKWLEECCGVGGSDMEWFVVEWYNADGVTSFCCSCTGGCGSGESMEKVVSAAVTLKASNGSKRSSLSWKVYYTCELNGKRIKKKK